MHPRYEQRRQGCIADDCFQLVGTLGRFDDEQENTRLYNHFCIRKILLLQRNTKTWERKWHSFASCNDSCSQDIQSFADANFQLSTRRMKAKNNEDEDEENAREIMIIILLEIKLL